MSAQLKMVTRRVRGLRDGRNTAGTALLLRRLEAAGCTVSLARTGRADVITPDGRKTVYELELDREVNNSPLTQALLDLETAGSTP